MVPYHICHFYGIWRSKEVIIVIIKSSFGMAVQVIRGGCNFNLERGFWLCNTAVLKLYCKFYSVL